MMRTNLCQLATVMITLIALASPGWAGGMYQQKINNIGGKPMNLSDYKGHPVLFVNIATKCGYTPQLDGLEALYQEYKEKGLRVVGIPSNDFGGQTPEDNEGVQKFCKLNYGVTFPLTEKAVVKGEKKHPLIAHLLEQSADKKEIKWKLKIS